MSGWRSLSVFRHTAGIHLAGLVGLVAWLALSRASPVQVETRLVCLAGAWCSLGLAWWLAKGVSGGSLLKILWTWALLFRGIAFVAQPVLEDDWFRYLWDGRMTATTGSPYGIPPERFFGDSSVPEPFQHILDRINYPQAPTVYGPVSQLAFWLAFLAAPGKLWPLKAILVLADLLTLVLVVRFAGPRNALLYAWCPLVIHETGFNAHPDSLGCLFALAAWAAARKQDSPWTVSGLLAIAGGVKLTGLVMAPFLLRRHGLRGVVGLGAGLALLYAPFLWQSGAAVAGPGLFGTDWEFNSSVFAVLSAVAGSAAARVLCGLAFGGFVLWQAARKGDSTRFDLVFGVLLLLSPVANPWYLIWAAPFAAMRPSAAIQSALAASALSYLSGLHLGDPSLGAYEHPWWVRPIEYTTILATAAAAGLIRLRTPRPETPLPQ